MRLTHVTPNRFTNEWNPAMNDNLAGKWIYHPQHPEWVAENPLADAAQIAETQARRDADDPHAIPHLRITTDDVAPRPRLLRSPLPRTTVLHTRVVAGSGGGPDKTILRSPRFADATYLRMAAAYIHPKVDAGIHVIRQHARELNCPLFTIGERGPVDPRTVRALYQLCKKLRVTVWHAHDYKSNLIGLLLRKFRPMKLVTTVHGWTNDTRRTRLYYHVDRYCLPRYDHVIAVSPTLEQHCLKLGVQPANLSYVPNAIDADEFRRSHSTLDARYELGVWPKAFVIGIVGRLSREKGVDRAIRAAATLYRKYPHLELHIVGDGPELDRLRLLAIELGVDQATHFWGWQADARRHYETMDMLLLPSRTEGSPNAVLEAMAMGVPVAAAEVGAVRDLLKHGRRGVLLNADDESNWALHIEPLIVSESRREELSRKGRRRVEKYFDFKQRMSRVLDVYDHLLSIEPMREDTSWRRAA